MFRASSYLQDALIVLVFGGFRFWPCWNAWGSRNTTKLSWRREWTERFFSSVTTQCCRKSWRWVIRQPVCFEPCKRKGRIQLFCFLTSILIRYLVWNSALWSTTVVVPCSRKQSIAQIVISGLDKYGPLTTDVSSIDSLFYFIYFNWKLFSLQTWGHFLSRKVDFYS